MFLRSRTKNKNSAQRSVFSSRKDALMEAAKRQSDPLASGLVHRVVRLGAQRYVVRSLPRKMMMAGFLSFGQRINSREA